MTAATSRSDQDLKTAVIDELSWDPSIDSTTLGVSVSDGTVTLSGEVHSYPEKVSAVKATQRVHGVTAIAQGITVLGTGWGSLNDTDIARNAGDALERAVDVPDTIKASVHDRVITLTGEGQQHQRLAAERAVRSLGGVRGIHDYVLLGTPTAAVATGIQDAIGRAFARNAVLDESRLTVTCAPDGAVTLDGDVSTWGERDQAQYAAWAAPGVTSVTDRLRVGHASGQ